MTALSLDSNRAALSINLVEMLRPQEPLSAMRLVTRRTTQLQKRTLGFLIQQFDIGSRRYHITASTGRSK